jgi:hypothetical protein
MTTPDQKKLFDVLEQQQEHQRRVDRVLYIVLPIMAFLISVICANLNWQSTLGTLVILIIAFIAVGIKRSNKWIWLGIITVYSLIDIYFSYSGQLPSAAVGRHLGTMLTFTFIIAIARPYIDRWLMKN